MARRLQGGYDSRLQVKQYVGKVEGDFCSFRVFETGDAQHYLFSQIDPNDCDTGLQFPIKKTDLMPECRRALRHGVSFSLPAFRRLQKLQEVNG